MSMANTLAGGFLALVVALGVGACFNRLMRNLPSRFGLVVSLISGAAIIDLLVALLLIVTRMTAPMGQIQQAAQQFARLLAVYDTICELQSELLLFACGHETGGEGAFPEGRIAFEKVSLLHTARSGLRSIDLAIEPGECLAVTGPSGAGKTTFADLLVGLYPPQSGRITAGGVALEGVTLAVR